MNIGASGLTQAIGSMGLDRPQAMRPGTKPVEAVPPITNRPQNPGQFEKGLTEVRAVQAGAKTDQPLPPANPNLPRGSLINLKV